MKSYTTQGGAALSIHKRRTTAGVPLYFLIQGIGAPFDTRPMIQQT
jgi:hypothetical protein